LLKPSTSDSQVKFDSVEKQRSYRLFRPTDFSAFKIVLAITPV